MLIWEEEHESDQEGMLLEVENVETDRSKKVNQ